MVAETKTFTKKEGLMMVESMAKAFNMTTEKYLAEKASDNYLLVKSSKGGLKVAVFNTNAPQVFSTAEMAENEMRNEDFSIAEKENTATEDFKYTGFEVMREIDYWKAIGVAE